MFLCRTARYTLFGAAAVVGCAQNLTPPQASIRDVAIDSRASFQIDEVVSSAVPVPPPIVPTPSSPLIGTWTRVTHGRHGTLTTALTFHEEGTVTDTWEQRGPCRGRFVWQRIWSPTAHTLSASLSCTGGAVCDGPFGSTIARLTCRTEKRDRWTYQLSTDGSTLSVRGRRRSSTVIYSRTPEQSARL